MIEIKNLTKSYGNNEVLKGIGMRLEAGKAYGMVGKNGAGKSTLFRCIAGIEDYATGELKFSNPELRLQIGVLDTNPVFLSRMTAWEYLKLHCIARGIKTEDFEAQNIFELPLDRYAELYSTGMKKKLALMAILLQQNSIYILDEPFNGVDLQSSILISGIIDKLKAAGKLVLISSHIFSTLRDNCDKIYLLKEGRISKAVNESDYTALEEEIKEDILSSHLDKLRIL